MRKQTVIQAFSLLSLGFIVLGYYLGYYYQEVTTWFLFAPNSMAVAYSINAALLCILFLMIYRYKRVKRLKESYQEDSQKSINDYYRVLSQKEELLKVNQDLRVQLRIIENSKTTKKNARSRK